MKILSAKIGGPPHPVGTERLGGRFERLGARCERPAMKALQVLEVVADDKVVEAVCIEAAIVASAGAKIDAVDLRASNSGPSTNHPLP